MFQSHHRRTRTRYSGSLLHHTGDCAHHLGEQCKPVTLESTDMFRVTEVIDTQTGIHIAVETTSRMQREDDLRP